MLILPSVQRHPPSVFQTHLRSFFSLKISIVCQLSPRSPQPSRKGKRDVQKNNPRPWPPPTHLGGSRCPPFQIPPTTRGSAIMPSYHHHPNLRRSSSSLMTLLVIAILLVVALFSTGVQAQQQHAGRGGFVARRNTHHRALAERVASQQQGGGVVVKRRRVKPVQQKRAAANGQQQVCRIRAVNATSATTAATTTVASSTSVSSAVTSSTSSVSTPRAPRAESQAPLPLSWGTNARFFSLLSLFRVSCLLAPVFPLSPFSSGPPSFSHSGDTSLSFLGVFALRLQLEGGGVATLSGE